MTKASRCGGSSKPGGNGSPARMYFPPVTRWTESFVKIWKSPATHRPSVAEAERTASKPIHSLMLLMAATLFIFFPLTALCDSLLATGRSSFDSS